MATKFLDSILMLTFGKKKVEKKRTSWCKETNKNLGY